MPIQSTIPVNMSLKVKQICLKYSLAMFILLFWLPGFSQYNFGGLDKLLLDNKRPWAITSQLLSGRTERLFTRSKTPILRPRPRRRS